MSACNSRDQALPAAERYRRILGNSRKSRLPADFAQPQPPAAWPEENITLLERYLVWLVEDGAGSTCIDLYYLPVAGHALGFNLKPHPQLDLARDLECVMAFAQAKQLSERVVTMYRHALERFRRFLALERGEAAPVNRLKPANIEQYHDGLPGWLISQLIHYQHLRQANWRPARLNQALLKFWSTHTRLFRWLFSRYAICGPNDIRRDQVFAYIDERLAAGTNPKSVNQDLRAFQAVLRFLRERDFSVPQALLRLPGLKEPDALPRFLTDEQVNRLRADLKTRVQQAAHPSQQRNALLDRAAFYLLWQGGLRLGEVEELRLDDLNLAQRQLVVRRGKGMQDRAVYLTDTAVAALAAYLAVRGRGATGHVFLYRHRPLCKDFIRGRIKAAGERTGVKVTPHQLRHTFATQLLNAGCRITTIQTLLGHRHPSSTLTYARIHDHTVAADYQAAMAVIEQRFESHLNPAPEPASALNEKHLNENGNESNRLLALVESLALDNLDQNQQALLAELRRCLQTLAA